MESFEQKIALLQELLGCKPLPRSYIQVVQDEGLQTRHLPLVGLPLSLELDSVWGATEYLRSLRPDLSPELLVLHLEQSRAFCLDLAAGDAEKAPVVEVNLEDEQAPRPVCTSLFRFLEDPQAVIGPAPGTAEDPWFRHGLKRLDQHMNNLSYQYDHAQGGKLPRAHVWRPLRFCVQDVILGLTVIRHDKKYNRLEVDVFLTAEIPEYEPDSGCRALALIILSDAYKCGGSMEIKFTREVEGGRVPRELVDLADRLGVELNHVNQGGLTPQEAKEFYLALSEFKPAVRSKVLELEEAGRLSSASLCYAMNHGIWTAQELEVILMSSAFPESLLTGLFSTEFWHLFQHDLQLGRNALMGGYLERNLLQREHWMDQEESVVELEDDQRSLGIDFDPDLMAKRYSLGDDEEAGLQVPWLVDECGMKTLAPGRSLLVLLRGREGYDLDSGLRDDIQEAVRLKHQGSRQDEEVFILVPADFRNMETTALCRAAAENGIGFMVCPEFVNHLDREVAQKIEATKVMRQ